MKSLLRILSLSLSLLFVGTSSAQSKVGFSTQTQCLTVYASPYYYDSCESISWSVSNTVIGKTSSLKHTFSTAGTYTLCMKVVNNCKKWDTTICQQIKVAACPCDTTKVVMSVTKDTATCGKYKFNVTPKNSSNSSLKYSYSWDFGNGSTSSNADPTQTYTKDGSYKTCVTVKWTLSNNTSCTKTVCETITVKCSTQTKKCDWSKTKISITNKCNAFRFEAGPADSCISYYWVLDNTKYKGNVIDHKFSTKDSQNYCLIAYNSCLQCDTTICGVVYNDCLPKSCNWSNYQLNTSYANVKDSCGKIVMEATAIKDTCIRIDFYWGNTLIENKRGWSTRVTKNGSYPFGFRYVNKCTGCDTTIWKYAVVECLSKPKCTWPTNMGFKVAMTTCPKLKIGINAFDDSCFQITAVVNNTTIKPLANNYRYYEYTMTQNGKYSICLNFKNLCTGCDTTICTTWSTDCIKTTKCDWSRFDFRYGNNCRTYSFESTPYTDSCIVQKMKIVSGNTVIYFETGTNHTFTFKENGYYNVCFWAKNECLNCDTWICQTVYVNCKDTTPINKCSLQGKDFGVGTSAKDSCVKIFEAPYFANGCVKYKWYIEGSSTVKTSRVVDYKFPAWGAYVVKLIMIDTCNKCDTAITKVVGVYCGKASNQDFEAKLWQPQPNPAFDNITFNNSEALKIELLNSLGQIILTKEIQAEEALYVGDIATGTYYIRLTGSAKNTSYILIKQ